MHLTEEKFKSSTDDDLCFVVSFSCNCRKMQKINSNSLSQNQIEVFLTSSGLSSNLPSPNKKLSNEGLSVTYTTLMTTNNVTKLFKVLDHFLHMLLFFLPVATTLTILHWKNNVHRHHASPISFYSVLPSMRIFYTKMITLVFNDNTKTD